MGKSRSTPAKPVDPVVNPVDPAAKADTAQAVHTPAPEAASVPETRQEPEMLEAVVDAAKGLNLRQGPGRSFPAICVLEPGTPLEVVPLPFGVEVPGWALVRVCDVFGWVDIRFLAEAGD